MKKRVRFGEVNEGLISLLIAFIMDVIRAHSSAGRAPALQAGGHRFEPYCAHHLSGLSAYCGPVVQLVRMPACHAGGRRFEPDPDRQNTYDYVEKIT